VSRTEAGRVFQTRGPAEYATDNKTFARNTVKLSTTDKKKQKFQLYAAGVALSIQNFKRTGQTMGLTSDL